MSQSGAGNLSMSGTAAQGFGNPGSSTQPSFVNFRNINQMNIDNMSSIQKLQALAEAKKMYS